MEVGDLVGATLPALRRPGEPVRHHPVARQGRAHARRAGSSKASPAPASTSTDGRVAAVDDRATARSAATRWCSPPACGRGRSARSPASASRCSRSSISTSSPRRSTASRRAWRPSAIPTGAPISRRRSAASPSAATSRIRSPGRPATCRRISSSSSSTTTGIISSSIMEAALARIPALATAGIKQMINGPESFTPDGNFILGEAPEVRNFFVGTGFNAFGIASAGGAGWVLAQWVTTGEQPIDLWVGRHPPLLRPAQGSRLDARAHARGLWQALHRRLSRSRSMRAAGRASSRRSTSACEAQRAVFGSKLGWERANWFAAAGGEARDVYSFGRGNWFDAVGARAPRRARSGRAVRPVVLRQVRGPRPRRRGGAVVDRRQ